MICVGDIVQDSNDKYIVLKEENEKYIIQSLGSNERFVKNEEWVNNIKIIEKRNQTYLRSPHICAKFYGEMLKKIYRNYKKEFKTGKYNLKDYIEDYRKKVVEQGLVYCLADFDSKEYQKYKDRINKEIDKEIEVFLERNKLCGDKDAIA